MTLKFNKIREYYSDFLRKTTLFSKNQTPTFTFSVFGILAFLIAIC